MPATRNPSEINNKATNANINSVEDCDEIGIEIYCSSAGLVGRAGTSPKLKGDTRAAVAVPFSIV